ncbi:hypothetical protein B0H14DRAFT_2440282, partial [Mycena olivaceomarginata]
KLNVPASAKPCIGVGSPGFKIWEASSPLYPKKVLKLPVEWLKKLRGRFCGCHSWHPKAW